MAMREALEAVRLNNPNEQRHFCLALRQVLAVHLMREQVPVGLRLERCHDCHLQVTRREQGCIYTFARQLSKAFWAWGTRCISSHSVSYPKHLGTPQPIVLGMGWRMQAWLEQAYSLVIQHRSRTLLTSVSVNRGRLSPPVIGAHRHRLGLGSHPSLLPPSEKGVHLFFSTLKNLLVPLSVPPTFTKRPSHASNFAPSDHFSGSSTYGLARWLPSFLGQSQAGAA